MQEPHFTEYEEIFDYSFFKNNYLRFLFSGTWFNVYLPDAEVSFVSQIEGGGVTSEYPLKLGWKN